MKTFVFLVIVVASVFASSENSCYNDMVEACNAMPKESLEDFKNCGASYGGIKKLLPYLQAYVNTHLSRSFEYLLTSTHYGNYEKSRRGFEILFRKLSDSKWEEAFDLIKYIAKRGERMNFAETKPDSLSTGSSNYELYELESIANALDVEKDLALEAHKIHEIATRRHGDHYDPEISSHIENEFVHKHASIIRKLSGHAFDLKKMLDSPDKALAVQLFDEYLEKSSL